MNQYKVYLIDDQASTTEWVELDCESVDFQTLFAIGDVEDISKRSDSRTKQLSFKGTKNNNQAFGSLFHLNTQADPSSANRLFFNYNPLISVDCVIMEDSLPILKGSIRVLEITVDAKGNITYQTVVTGSMSDFVQGIKDRLLDEIDLTDLRHRMTWGNIKQSWDSQTERYDAATNTYSSQPFEMGRGYVYPHIDYGHRFTDPTLAREHNNDYKLFNVYNYRPALYVRELLDRMFDSAGFKYEVKGSPSFQAEFDSMIIPNNQERLSTKDSLRNFQLRKVGNQVQDNARERYSSDRKSVSVGISLEGGLNSQASDNLINYYGTFLGSTKTVFNVSRTFTSDGNVRVEFANISNLLPFIPKPPLKFILTLGQREAKLSTDPTFHYGDFEAIASSSVTVYGGLPLTNHVMEFPFGEHRFERGKQLMLMMTIEIPLPIPPIWLNLSWWAYTITSARIDFPRDLVGGQMEYESQLGDEYVPTLPAGIKQLDFLKSLILLNNMYVYPDRDDRKKLVFQKHDDYYWRAHPALISDNSVNWSGKVDHSREVKIKSNLDIPKQYLFTFKDDSDYINKQYKENYGRGYIYGSLSFTDSLGVTDLRKVEVIFSPSPLVGYPDTGRTHPSIIAFDKTKGVTPIKSNVRIVYYNGIRSCVGFTVCYEGYDAGTFLKTDVETLPVYPQCGEFHLDTSLNNLTPLSCIHFGPPEHYFFNATQQHLDCDHRYGDYRAQVTGLTNPNVVFVECLALLNEVDISNLDLQVPVYLDMGPLGHAYFKVLSVEYTDQHTPSRIKLQKVAV